MKVGVYNHISIIDFSGVSDYLKGLMDEYKELREKTKGRKYPKALFEDRLSRLRQGLENIDEIEWDEDEFSDKIPRALATFARYADKCPEDIKELFTYKHEVRMPKRVRTVRLPHPTPIFDSRVIPILNDVVSIEKKHVDEKKWLFDVIIIKKSGLTAFKKDLQCIPPIKEGMKILKEKRQFSQRYVFRPYPWAVTIWLKDDSSITVPEDLRSFLHGAIGYIFSREWRTSIVLSAISVESMLADLYEEKYKEPAPDTPLGDLFRQVREKIDFPPEIVDAIEMTNESRIAAVHRSRFPVSAREATNALYGATNFTMWYSSQF